MLNGRLNGAVGCERPDAVWPLPSNDIGMQAISGLNYMDTVRSSRGGSAVEFNDAEKQIAQSSVQAAGMVENSKETMSTYYCKNLANSLLKQTFLMAHKVLREEIAQPIKAKVNDEWTEVNPANWQPRQRARVVVGLSSMEKRNRVAGLTQMMGQLEAWIGAGLEGIITNKEKVYNAAVDWMRAAELTDHPEEYLINPNSQEAQQVAQQQAQAQEEQQQMMQQMQQQQAQFAMMLEEFKQAQETERKRMDLAWKYYDTRVDAELQEADMTGKHVENMTGQAGRQVEQERAGDKPHRQGG